MSHLDMTAETKQAPFRPSARLAVEGSADAAARPAYRSSRRAHMFAGERAATAAANRRVLRSIGAQQLLRPINQGEGARRRLAGTVQRCCIHEFYFVVWGGKGSIPSSPRRHLEAAAASGGSTRAAARGERPSRSWRC